MNTATNVIELHQRNPLDANLAELKALKQFISTDETRAWMCQVWVYATETGRTYVATDGHTMAIRKSGDHRTMTDSDIFKMGPVPSSTFPQSEPPRWSNVMQVVATSNKLAEVYSINPDYVARVATIESAAGKREAEDFQPKAGMSRKHEAAHRAHLKSTQCATVRIPSQPLDPWRFTLKTTAATWEVLIMPRRP